ncbi:SMAD/FHA domain-containing protein [Thelephora ganbajun]|uniref:SMAD/FHA domain-containing protein n=1 Tax=Thelephora ganbajun TaxID=370292 RepID=A0ACB6ZEU9_THEGA|nr:SMAD/FHA domain-containing protein [Thelephora ganbajun]
MLRRRRSAGALASQQSANPQSPPLPQQPPTTLSATSNPSSRPSHRIRLVPHLDSRRSLRFDPISRDVKEGDVPLRIGRFTDRSGLGIANAPGSNKLAFKSKVVSRAHAEIWAENGGKFFIRDTKSSSGTFLNHVRLSPANSESRPFELKDGDVLQLGVDYQGGTEDIYKCVKIKVEVNREWQATPNAFNTNAIKQLRALTGALNQPGTSGNKKISAKSAMADCCICLFAVAINQALFIAPCSHTFHYKCIRPLLDAHHPAFNCPLCRTFADLEEDVEVDIDLELDIVADEEGSDVPPKTAIEPKDEKGLPMTPGTAFTTSIRDRIEREAAEDAIVAGAETEVEHDLGSRMTRIGGSRWQRSPLMPGGMAVDVAEADDEDELMANRSHSPSPHLRDVLEAANRDRSVSPIPVTIPSRAVIHDEFIVEGGDVGSVDGFGEEHPLSKHKPVIN